MGWNALSGSYARDVDARSLLEKLVNPSSKSEKAEEFLSGLDEELFIDLMEMLTSKMALVATVITNIGLRQNLLLLIHTVIIVKYSYASIT